MAARTALFGICMFWLAYEAHFSPTFFITTVRGSVADIVGGLDAMMASEDYGTTPRTVVKAENTY